MAEFPGTRLPDHGEPFADAQRARSLGLDPRAQLAN